MVSPSFKKKLMIGLVTAFVVQTALVYGDSREQPISEAAVRGRKLWHKNSCQVCHQIYGNGGFLGPDITNAASRVDEVRLTQLLTVGSGQMPSFHMTDDQIQDVRAYLEALDRPDLGRGQLRLGREETSLLPWDRFDAAVAEVSTVDDSEVRAGAALFRSRICSSCHLPLERSPSTNAPDVSLTFDQISEDELRSILVSGRPSRGMPPPFPAFTNDERDQVVEFLRWLRDNREFVASGMEITGDALEIGWRDLPWWEFR